MKIGILTFHRAHNYGALLQAYALQTYLRGLGCQAEMIDYWPNYHDSDYKLIPHFKARSFLGKIKAILLLILGFRRILRRSNGYKQFIINQFGLDSWPRYRSDEAISDLAYDLVIYGSDQVWRHSIFPGFKGFSDVYFGDYPKNVTSKISYAASMGRYDNIDVNDKLYLKEKLSNFTAISVREQELKQLVEEVVDKSIMLVLDPVFLLEKVEWLHLSFPARVENRGKYIFFYHQTYSKEAIEFTNILEAHFGYKVIEVRGRVEPLLFGNRYRQTASPAEYISLLYNAEIVVSTSFHGTAFSIIFEKQFYALGMNSHSGRVRTIVQALAIPNRLLTDIHQVDFNERIDYSRVYRKMKMLKLRSKEFLELNISDINSNV